METVWVCCCCCRLGKMTKKAWSENVVCVSRVFEPNFVARMDLWETRLARKSLLYQALKPVGSVAKLAGLFSTSTVGSWKFSQEQDISVKRCNSNLIFATLVVTFIMVDVYTAFKDVSLASFANLDGAATVTFESFTRLCGLFVLIFMIITPQNLVNYLNYWKRVNANLLPFADQLRKEGVYVLILTVSLTACCLVLSAWHMIGRFLPLTPLSGIVFAVKLVGYTLSLFNCLFISFSSVLFVRALMYGFRCVQLNLFYLLKDKPSDLSSQLESLRHRYEMLHHLSHLTSRVYSPMLTVILLGFSVSLCMLFLLFGIEASRRENPATIVRLTGSITYRIIPVILICVVGEQLTNESCFGLRHIYSGVLKELPKDSWCQIRLLESKMLLSPARITASGFVYIDYRLLAQIAGVIVTYSLVIIQFRKAD